MPGGDKSNLKSIPKNLAGSVVIVEDAYNAFDTDRGGGRHGELQHPADGRQPARSAGESERAGHRRSPDGRRDQSRLVRHHGRIRVEGGVPASAFRVVAPLGRIVIPRCRKAPGAWPTVSETARPGQSGSGRTTYGTENPSLSTLITGTRRQRLRHQATPRLNNDTITATTAVPAAIIEMMRVVRSRFVRLISALRFNKSRAAV